MAQRTSSIIAGKLSSMLNLDDSTYQWLKYFLECKLITLANFVAIFTLAAILHQLLAALVFSLFFLILRKFTGGYHARTPLQCGIFSCAMCFATIYIAYAIPPDAYVAVSITLLLVSSVGVYCLAPVDHPNLQLSESEKRRLKSQSRIVIICECILAACAFLTPVPSYYVMLASMSPAIL